MPSPQTNPEDEPSAGYEGLLADLKPLATAIVKLQTEMKAAGLFANDRELLECPFCCLQEDVLSGGKLITCEPDSPGTDTGLSFTALDSKESWWCCPRCGAEFASEGFSA